MCLSLYVYIRIMCVIKNMPVCVLLFENLHEKSAASSELIVLHVKMFSVLASLAREANPWLSKAMCPCKSTLWHCGCVTQPPIHIDVLACTQSHMYRHVDLLKRFKNGKVVLEALDDRVSAFCDVVINC